MLNDNIKKINSRLLLLILIVLWLSNSELQKIKEACGIPFKEKCSCDVVNEDFVIAKLIHQNLKLKEKVFKLKQILNDHHMNCDESLTIAIKTLRHVQAAYNAWLSSNNKNFKRIQNNKLADGFAHVNFTHREICIIES